MPPTEPGAAAGKYKPGQKKNRAEQPLVTKTGEPARISATTSNDPTNVKDLSMETVVQRLQSDMEKGLTEEEARRRLEEFGESEAIVYATGGTIMCVLIANH